MSNEFQRKARLGATLGGPFQNPVCMCLLRVMFDLAKEGDTQTLDAAKVQWPGPDYSPKEFAAFINRSQWAVYKWLDPDGTAQFPVQHFFDFLAFVRDKSNRTDDRLAAYVAEIAGYADKVRAIQKIIDGGKA